MLPTTRIRQRIEALKAAGQWRDPGDGGTGVADPQTIDVRSNDYLGLAAGVASRETGSWRGPVRSGSGASRLISGTWSEHLELEATLAEWLQAESCLLFSSGYAANVGAISALAGPGETIFSDALNHASIVDGCRLSRAEVVVLPHGDLAALARALDHTQGVRWVITESYFGMDADCPDLQGIAALCAKHEAALIVDEAHALGVFGQEGRGLCEEAGIEPDVLIGGMGKALGIHGGFVACSRELRGWLWNRARSFVFSTAPSPVLCGLALDHLRQLRGADGARSRLRALEARFEAALLGAGVPSPSGRRGPIFPIVLGDEAATMNAAAQLRERGIAAQAIRPPTVPRGGSRLRITLRADLEEAQVDAVAAALGEVWRAAVAARPALLPQGQEARRGVLGAESRSALAAPPAAAGVGGRPSSAAGPDHESADSAVTAPRSFAAGGSRKLWIVLGTGTGVGKTFVAEGLVRLLGARGSAVAGLKPIETGWPGPMASGSDAERLQAASFHVKQPSPHPLYGFPDPVAPSLAARRASSVIDPAAVLTWLQRVVPLDPEDPLSLVLETAGGVFSPLSQRLTNFDLARSLGNATWVLVAPDRLGVLHDTLSTLRAMEASGQRPDWLILSAPESPDPSTGTNLDELRRLNLFPRLLSLPRGETAALRALLGPANT